MLKNIFDGLSSQAARPKILVVDDQPVNIHLINEIFKQDLDVLMATSGIAALDLCKSQAPDLVILDVVMPDMTGYDVCRALKTDPLTRDIPIIFLTSLSEEQDEIFGFELGAVDFINKPISPIVVKSRVATHLRLKLQTDLLRAIGLTDGMTGIANRRRFDETLDQQWRTCERDQKPLSLIILDVDFFKTYNDHYGHLMGDQCLKTIAHALEKNIRRPTDLVARYGGEEFACILPTTDSVGALNRAVELLNAVRNLKIEHAMSEVAREITISAGVATLIPNRSNSLLDLVGCADKALYLAKNGGRNRVQVVDELLLPST
ncbi:diguanylate cyclase [Reinekea sp.]|jgi:diguanylate cyclase (GGDEF)-like protein|uniref:diguanylate cyclase n=1 Tax=Reinekea sp. TaxID=1970455 RepID=UPI002A8019FC|nr:diguanylate cyclase [Reinekea sp.]